MTLRKRLTRQNGLANTFRRGFSLDSDEFEPDGMSSLWP
jgi:hypothetical protein